MPQGAKSARSLLVSANPYRWPRATMSEMERERRRCYDKPPPETRKAATQFAGGFKSGMRLRRAGPASAVAGAVELGVEGLGALHHGEFDGHAVFEMAHDLAAHRAQRHLDAERRLDVDLDRGA